MKTIKKWYCVLFLFLFVFNIAIICSPQQFFNKEVRDLEQKYDDTLENEIHISALNDTLILRWNRSWGGLNHDLGYDITIDDSSNLFIVGKTNSFGLTNYDLCVLKFNAMGDLLLNFTWGSSRTDYYPYIVTDKYDNIYITGQVINGSVYDHYLVKFDSSGNQLWNITYNSPGVNHNSGGIAVDSDANVYVCGHSAPSGEGTIFMYLLKFDAQGNLLWETRWAEEVSIFGMDYGVSTDGMRIDSADNIYVTGHLGSRNYYNGDADLFLVKFNTAGNLIWERIWGGDKFDGGRGIAFDSVNNVYVVGGTASQAAYVIDVILVKCNPSGVQEWNKTFNNQKYDQGMDVDIDSSDDIYITGYTTAGSGECDLIILKYNNTGSLVWSETVDLLYSIEGYGIVIDDNDSVFLTGSYKTQSGFYDIFLLKYDFPVPVKTVHILSPQGNKIYGPFSPYFNLDLDGDFYKLWYTLNKSQPYSINTLNGNINQSAWNLLGNGTVLLEFFVQDYFGNNISTNVTIHKDLYYPQIKINQPTFNQIIGISPPEYNITIWSLTLDSFWYNLNDGSNYSIDTTSGVINQSAWDDCGHGNVSMKFYANNTLGQTNFKEIIIRKDSTPPIFSIVSPTSNQLFGVNTLDFQLMINEDNLDSCQYSLNGGLNYTFTGSNSTINQEAWDICINGTVIIQFYLNDTVGNSETRGIVVRKDIITPNNIIISPNSGQIFINSVPSFNVSISDPNLNSTWYTLNNGINHYFSGSIGTFNQTSWNSCVDGLVLAKFYAEDSVGNINISYVFIKKNVYTVSRDGYALIVGIENYPGSTYDLWYCRDDALLVYDLLINNFNYKPENVYLLLDGGATRSAISTARGAIENKITPEDTFFFFYSGHGGENVLRPWEEYICPYDSLPDNPSKFIYDYMWDLWLDNMDCAEKYIILDSCRSGGFITYKSNRFYMTACGSSEDAYEDSSLGSGVFTYYFLRAMDAVSDSNGDGVISLEEWFSYIDSNTKAISPQDPQFYDGISGSAVLHPSIGEVSVTFLGNQVDYLFTLFGQGLIETLKLQVCSISNSIYYEEIILLPDVTTFSGFETYTGSITFVEIQDITGYRLYAEISGNEILIIEISDGLDSDGDTLLDIIEILDWGTDPRLNDTDGDLLSDDYEIFVSGTNPLLIDTDGDGYEDGWEVYNGYDPLDPNDYPIEPTKSNSQSIPMGNYFLIFLWLTIICISIFQYKKRIKIK